MSRLPVIAVTLFILAFAPRVITAGDVQTVLKNCHSGQPNCGPSGPDQTVLLNSLKKGIKTLPQGLFDGLSGQQSYGFPAEVVAAAYGIKDGNRHVSLGGLVEAVGLFPLIGEMPHYYSYDVQRVMISDLQHALAQAKLHMIEPSDAPALVALDIPGIGPALYDADQIRVLVSTGLFPYPMRIEWKRDGGVRVPYIQLDRDAASFAAKCLDEATNPGGHGCPLALAPPKKPWAMNAPGQSGSDGLDASGGPELRGASLNSMFDRTVKPDKIIKNPKRDVEIAEILIPGTTQSIEVQTKYCELWADAEPDHRVKDPTDVLGCQFELTLTIPRAASRAYSQLRVWVNPLKPDGTIGMKCGPVDEDLKISPEPNVDAHKRCWDQTAKLDYQWRISGNLLKPSIGTGSSTQQLFVWVYRRRDSAKDPDPADKTKADIIKGMFQIEILIKGDPQESTKAFLIDRGWVDATTYRWQIP